MRSEKATPWRCIGGPLDGRVALGPIDERQTHVELPLNGDAPDGDTARYRIDRSTHALRWEPLADK